ncbi:MAG: YtxH domain-containing protein [Bacteroidia bacterium]
MTKQTKIVTGLLAGAALGAVVALVLTSDKNDILKQRATDWFCDLLENSKDKMGSIGNLLSESLAKVKA